MAFTTNKVSGLKFSKSEIPSQYGLKDSLNNLSSINIFIGSNNSGKSRFMRELSNIKITNNSVFIENQLFEVLTSKIELMKSYSTHVSQNFEQIRDFEFEYGHQSYNLKPLLDYKPPENRTPTDLSNLIDVIINHIDFVNHIKNTQIIQLARNGYSSHRQDSSYLKPLFTETLSLAKFPSDLNNYKINLTRKQFYIPIIRGLRPFTEKEDFYERRTKGDYFSDYEIEIVTGLKLYDELVKHLLGTPTEREIIRQYENFLSQNFFDQKTVTLIPKYKSDVVEIKIGNDEQFPITKLGDGLQHLLILTFPPFIEESPSLFFIEEPDICMHPSMQRSLISALLINDQHQYFITTHSNHFLDIAFECSDISLFKFSKIEEGNQSSFQISVVDTVSANNILQELGVRPSSVLHSNCTIWVEGITDRLYLTMYMKTFLITMKTIDSNRHKKYSSYRQDFHYSFVEYQGSTLDHWHFSPQNPTETKINAISVCSNALVIADNDISSKGDRVERLRQQLGDRLVLLPAKEIENLIPEELLKAAVSSKFAKHKKDINEISYGAYSKKTVKIGNYLDGISPKTTESKIFAENSGTIKNKLGICKQIIDFSNSGSVQWNMTAEINDICEKIFNHIDRMNT